MTTEYLLSEMKEEPGHHPASLAAEPTARSDGEISLLDLLIVLAERKRIIFWVTAVCAILAIVISLLLPSRYTATVTILPPQQNSSLSGILASQVGGLGGMAALAGSSLGLKNPNDMIVGMIKSRVVEDAMIQRFGLMQEYRKKYLSDARKEFEHYTNVDGGGKDGLIHISVEDANPGRAAEMANGYVDQFRSLSEHLAITDAAQRRLFFEQQLAQAKDNLANAEEALKQTEETTGLIQVDSQARALIESAASLRAQIVAKEVQIQAMETYANGENAELVEAKQELDSLRAELAKLGGTEEASGGLMVPKGKVPEASLEYVRKLRDVKYYETIFDILARQYELAKLDEAKEGALIQVVDPAVPPDRRSFPKRSLFAIGGLIAGLLAGILAALVSAGATHLMTEPVTSAKLVYFKQMLSWKPHTRS